MIVERDRRTKGEIRGDAREDTINDREFTRSHVDSNCLNDSKKPDLRLELEIWVAALV